MRSSRALPAAWRHPHSGEPLDRRPVEIECPQRVDKRLLEVPDVELDVLAVLLQVEDRVADQLAWPVERGLPSAVGLDDLDPAPSGRWSSSVSVRRRP